MPGEKECWLSDERLGLEDEPAAESTRLRLSGCEVVGVFVKGVKIVVRMLLASNMEIDIWRKQKVIRRCSAAKGLRLSVMVV